MAQNNKFAIENKIDEHVSPNPSSLAVGSLPHPSSFQHSSMASPSLSARLGLTPLSGTTAGSNPPAAAAGANMTHLQLESLDLDVGNYSSMSLDEYVKHMGGNRSLSRVLIANNGIAAVKAIRSIKKWAYETFSDDKVIKFVVMATPEDLRANAEYIHLADEFVHVPGGSNNNNYANIRLITEIAENTNCHAVWAGWGHASENPKLPDLLAKTKSKIVWIGPPSHAMRALGDKIGSTLIAQSAGVPCIPWSGDGLSVNYAKNGIPQDVYDKSCIANVEDAQYHADRIGYPVMVKASEGGGGKGIRRVESREELPMAYHQVQGEVPGSPIFIMKLAGRCRHLEVQLLCDSWGQSIAVFGRDCSIQRRHQKIIEEGPVVAAPPDIWDLMEKSAVRLAKEVGYVGAGTVEYLYMENGEYSFLELNPRLQVEHPVTELISGVNLPAAQLQIAMGIPLQRLPGIRRMYGESPLTETKIDFDSRKAQTLPGHVIACRITAENPDEKFQPTSGVIQELNFRSTPDVWGYFSVGAQGLVHEFADSQFGHLFAFGTTREIARKNMVQALREMEIRGEIRTTIEYLRVMIENEDFKQNKINTTWLEGVLANHTIAAQKPSQYLAVVCGALFRAHCFAQNQEKEYAGALASGHLPSSKLYTTLVQYASELIYQDVKYKLEVTKSGPNTYDLALLTPATSSNPSGSAAASGKKSGGDASLSKGSGSSTSGNGNGNGESSGEVPPAQSTQAIAPIFNRALIATCDIHNLSDGGYLVLLNGKKHVIHGREFPTGLRLSIDTMTCLFQHEYDPTVLRSDTQGKLVQFLVENGQHVHKDQPVAELEVMKMYITIKAPESGFISHVKGVGTVVESGDVIATFRLDNPDCIKRAQLCDTIFPEAIHADVCHVNKVSTLFRDSELILRRLLSGFILNQKKVVETLTILTSVLSDKMLPVLQFDELASNAAGRIPAPLLDALIEIVDQYRASLEAAVAGTIRPRGGSYGSAPSTTSHSQSTLLTPSTSSSSSSSSSLRGVTDFPVDALETAIATFVNQADKSQDKVNIVAARDALQAFGITQLLESYRYGNAIHAVQTLFGFIYEFLSVEETFQNPFSTGGSSGDNGSNQTGGSSSLLSTEDVLHHLRKIHKDNLSRVASIARAHHQLKPRCSFISSVLDQLLSQYAAILSSATTSKPIQDFTSLTGFSCGDSQGYATMSNIRQEWISLLHRLATLHHKDATIVSLKARRALVSLRLPSQKTRLYTTMRILDAALQKKKDYYNDLGMKTVDEDRVLSPVSTGYLGSPTAPTMNPAIEALVDQSQPIDDVILHFLSHPSDDIKALATEAYVRRAFQHFTIEDLDVMIRPTREQLFGKYILDDDLRQQVFGNAPELLCRFQFFMEPKGNAIHNRPALSASPNPSSIAPSTGGAGVGSGDKTSCAIACEPSPNRAPGAAPSSTLHSLHNLITPSPMHNSISGETPPIGSNSSESRMRRIDSLANLSARVQQQTPSAVGTPMRSQLFSPREDFDDDVEMMSDDDDDENDEDKLLIPVTASGLLLEQTPSSVFSPTSPTPSGDSPSDAAVVGNTATTAAGMAYPTLVSTPSTMTHNVLKTVKPIKRLGLLAHFTSLDTLRTGFSTVLAAFASEPSNSHLSRSVRMNSSLHVLYIYITSATNDTVQSLSQEIAPLLSAYHSLLTQYKVRRVTFIVPLHKGGEHELSYNLHGVGTSSLSGFPQLSLPTPLSITNRISGNSTGYFADNHDESTMTSDEFLASSIVVPPSYVTFRATASHNVSQIASDPQDREAKHDETPSVIYIEDKYIRQIEPNNALHLQLDRLDNYDYQLVPTTNRMVHLFAAIPHRRVQSGGQSTSGSSQPPSRTTSGGAAGGAGISSASTGGAKPPAKAVSAARAQYDGRRFFARVLVRRLNSVQRSRILNGKVVLDTNAHGEIDVTVPSVGTADAHPETEVAFVEALNSLEIAITAASANASSSFSSISSIAGTDPAANAVTEEVEILKRPGGNGRWLFNHIFVNVLVDVNVDNTQATEGENTSGSSSLSSNTTSDLLLPNDDGPLTSSTIINVEYVDSIIRSLTRRYADKIRRLHVTHVEFALTLRVMSAHTTTSIPIRFICNNPSGANLQIQSFYEQYDGASKKVLLRPIITRSRSNLTLSRFSHVLFKNQSIPPGALQTSGDGPLYGVDGDYQDADAFYDTTFPFQRQRLAAQALDTVWCYDFIEILDKAIRRSWRSALLSLVSSIVDLAFETNQEALTNWGLVPKDQSKVASLLMSALSLTFNYRNMTLETATTVMHVLIQAPLPTFRSAGISLIVAANLHALPKEQLTALCNEHDLQILSLIASILSSLPQPVYKLISEFAQLAVRIPDSFLDATELVLKPNPEYIPPPPVQSSSSTPQHDAKTTPEAHLQNVFRNGYGNYSSKFILTPMKREPGQNTHAMVAWDVVMSTPETLKFDLDLSIQSYGTSTREIVLISNDITLEAGSFGINEDIIFDLASKRARAKQIPRIYLAANSGARIGLAEEVKGKYKVAFIPGDTEYTKGFEYLYLTDKNYQELKSSVVCKPIVVNGETRYVITDVIGKRDCLGVENLRGSGQIAGETCTAYQNIFTLTYVNCRSVGIGAYLARLGQRIIQKADPAMPLLLTGYQALNKLLGRPVYSSNVQLGGPDIMYTNGVSHQIVHSDLEGCYNIVRWLSYVPVRRHATSIPLLTQSLDPVKRAPSFVPANKNALYDAHQLLIGTTPASPVVSLLRRFGPRHTLRDDALNNMAASNTPPSSPSTSSLDASTSAITPESGPDAKIPTVSPEVEEISVVPNQHVPLTGLFDKYSFMEVLGGWAKGVVAGRARLGGIPVGVVCVDTRTIEQTLPADPATADTKETVISRAGQVWFPDSSFKTAQAIKDMKTEDIPVIVLANWRGFSGGMHDMLNEILKFGSYIVDALVDIQQPVIVYLPPHSTLRGGAWVVVDETLNQDFMEMYSDGTARGGVLEPDGIVDVKFRRDQILSEIRRCDPILLQYNQALTISHATNDPHEIQRTQALIQQRETLLFPMYLQLATHFADLHDTPVRMLHKNCLRDIVDWSYVRERFHSRIFARLAEHQIIRQMYASLTTTTGGAATSATSNIVITSNTVDPALHAVVLAYIRKLQQSMNIDLISPSLLVHSDPTRNGNGDSDGSTHAYSSTLALVRGIFQLWLYQFHLAHREKTESPTPIAADDEMIIAPSGSASLHHDRTFIDFIKSNHGFTHEYLPQKLKELKLFSIQSYLAHLLGDLSQEDLAEVFPQRASYNA